MMKSKHFDYLILGTIILIIFCFTYYSYITEGLVFSLVSSDLDSIVSYIEGFGVIAGIMLILITIMEVIVAPIPPLVLYIASGILFGWFWGGTLALIGNVIGSVIAFLIARKLGRHYVERKISNKQRDKFDKFAEKHGALGIFFLRINPLTSSDIFSYLAGLTKMNLLSFVIGTTLGLAPLIYLQTYIGSDIIRNNPSLYLAFIWISIAYIVLFIGGIVLFSRRKKRK